MPTAEDDDSELVPRQGPGRRCDLGCESWPDEMIYQKCPECGEPTSRYTNLWPMDPEQARSILRHKAFEQFYEVHCDKKGQPVEGDLPGDPHAGIRVSAGEQVVREVEGTTGG